MVYEYKNTNRKQKKYIIQSAIVVGLVFVFSVWFFVFANSETTSNSESTQGPIAVTTSELESAQNDFIAVNEGDDEKTPSTVVHSGGATVVDNNGIFTNESTGQSTWSTSSTGEITVYTPTQDSRFVSGSVIEGRTVLDEVNFRIIDDNTGVISQGVITAVDGRFSGTASFSTSGQNGRIDVFGIQSDGVEFSNVEIDISYE